MLSFSSPLLGFLVKGVFFAESAILVHLKSVRVILFVFDRVIIALFALCASQSNLYSHDGTSILFLENFCLPHEVVFGAQKKTPLEV